MSMNDPISDILTRIRNGQRARLARVSAPASKAIVRLLGVLKDEGYIRDFATQEVRKGVTEVVIDLKYQDGEPVISEIARVSKPGRRIYMSKDELPRIRNGLGISIVSTSKGVMSDHQARQANVGGEVLCSVF